MPDINAGAISEALNNKVDIGYGNTSPKQPVTRQQVTNCILEDPQNIKLELSNGTLTLKAGSVVIVPNGFESDGTTPKFDEVEIESDASTTSWGTMTMNNVVMVWSKASGKFNPYDPSVCFSGSTAPTGFGTHALWYDTVNNLMKSTGDSGTTWATVYCLPVALISYSSGTPTSIDTTFQSIGYIGSTVFVRKGLKVLIPNGRNDDGSLKNIEVTTQKVYTNSGSSTDNNVSTFLYLENDELVCHNHNRYNDAEYDATKNMWWFDVSSRYSIATPLDYGRVQTSGVISNFKPYTTTNILKYSDSSQISSWTMPSSKSINLTLGASGASYTAPANGWYLLRKAPGSTSVDRYINFTCNSILIGSQTWSNETAAYVKGIFVPAKKGDTVNIYYTVDGTTEVFKFIYADGET